QLAQPRRPELERGDRADDERDHDPRPHLAVELVHAVGEHQARVGAAADTRGDGAFGRVALRSGSGAGMIHLARDFPLRRILRLCQKLLLLRITPTAIPSMVIESRRRSTSMGSKSGFSGRSWTELPRRRRRLTVTSSARRATTIWPVRAS